LCCNPFGEVLICLLKTAVKKKLFLFIVLIAATAAYPQSGLPNIPRIFSEIHSLPYKDGYVVYYSYKIPYNFLVFEKSNFDYKAKYAFGIEVSDSLAKSVKRASSERDVILEDFEKTNSVKDFEEGVLEIELKKGKYDVIPIFTDKNISTEVKQRSQVISALSGAYFQPIVTDAAPFIHGDKSYTALANYGGDVPFSETPYDIIIPAKDTVQTSINLLITNGADTVYNGAAKESFSAGLQFAECNSRIVLQGSKENATKNFILKGLSSKLYEGPLTISVLDSAKKTIVQFPLNVIWPNKPFILMNYEAAIKVLKNIEKSEVVDSLLSLSSSDYQKGLFGYWKKYDKTPDTKFNPLMAEFYMRADYAAVNFRTLTNKSGIETDRGKIYIKYGKPSKMERSTSGNGKITENWRYEAIGLDFSFIDNAGNGEFTLIKKR
jgi:GWxTD domain-containing protein